MAVQVARTARALGAFTSGQGSPPKLEAVLGTVHELLPMQALATTATVLAALLEQSALAARELQFGVIAQL